jgi:hypothetical protein
MAQPMKEEEINMQAGAGAGALLVTGAMIMTLAANLAGAGAVVGVGVVLLLFTMIRKGGIGSIITGAITTVGATVTTVGQSAVSSFSNLFRTAQDIKARAELAAEENRRDNNKAVQDTIKQIFELLGTAFDSSRQGLVFVRDQIVGEKGLVPEKLWIWFGISIYIVLFIGLRQLIKTMDRARVRRQNLENLQVFHGVQPAQPAAQAQGGIAGLFGMGGSSRRPTSLPTRRAGRSSSSSKRSYTHRRRALQTGKVGYRPTKTGRKV